PNAEQIGTSVNGFPILVYRFGSGKSERLIVAGIHGGNEYNTVLLAEQLIIYLTSNPQVIPPDKTLYILPDLNPDGFNYSWDIYGRANGNNVDLNHNFPYRWASAWDRSSCWHYLKLSGGKSPASEPETQALMGFLLSHPIQALISYHSAAMGIFPGGNPTFPPSINLAKAIAKVSHYPYPPLDTGCDYTGNLTDWAATLGIAAVDIELSNHRDTDFDQNKMILQEFLRWQK
ncbi:MAG: M14 family metallopeptidase, partial [Anaerolineales bacterium]